MITVSAAVFMVTASSSTPAHPFDSTKLRVSRDSFDLVFRGAGNRSAGFLVQTVSRDGGNFVVVVENAVRGMTVRSEMVMNAATLSPLTHREVIQVTGRGDLSGEVVFTNGRARGNYAAPGSPGTGLDAEIEPDVVDDDVATALLPTLPLADGYATSFRTFASPGLILTTSVRVAGRDTVTVPAGRFDAFRLVVMARDTTDIFVSVVPPRRLVLVRLRDGSGEMRLAK